VQSPQTIKKITDGCKSISAPLLLINGELDPVIAPYATIAVIKTLVNKKYFHNVLIKKAMHNPFKDTPNEYIDDIKTYLEKFN
jgi:pimeloyl-ACP methyl ester carboxylesterase